MSELKMVREKRIKWSDKLSRVVSWFVHTEGFTIEFWITVYTKEFAEKHPTLADGVYEGEPASPMGFEVHSRTPLYDQTEPDHEACVVLGGNCWHDGSSLAATEFFEWWDGSDEWAFCECENWVRHRLPEPEEVTA